MMIKSLKGLSQSNVKCDANDCFIFGIYFASKRSYEDTMDVGVDMIGMVKTNKKVSSKDATNNMKNKFPGGS